MSPLMALNPPFISVGNCFASNSALYKTCFTKVVLPLPLTPDTTVKHCSGNCTSIFFKLCKNAPSNWMVCFADLVLAGIGIDNVPFKYLPVKLFLSFINLAALPTATTSPPKCAAKGPMSII